MIGAGHIDEDAPATEHQNWNTELPSIPNSSMTEFGMELQRTLLEQTTLFASEFSIDEDSRSSWPPTSKALNSLNAELLNKIRNGMFEGLTDKFTAQEQLISDLLRIIGDDPVQREMRLTGTIERASIVRLFYLFLTSGRVAAQATIQPCNDSEYIGAILGFAQELSKYAIGRACEGDVRSVQLCREVITELNGLMLEFKFRNGALRRKYDGLKYVVKTLEDLLYDASVHSPDGESYLAPPRKKSKPDTAITSATVGGNASTDTSVRFIDGSEIECIRERLEKYDDLRESVIKDSRDVQNNAKKAIFSIHADKIRDATCKLETAEKAALKIFEIIEQYPTLRQGSFSNSLEEWAEGKLTLRWVNEKKIMSKHELGIVSTSEYIGALSDFTGEIGRFAVYHASSRDIVAVKEIYQADLVIASLLSELNVGNRFGRKLDAVNTNLKKVGDLIYELSVFQRSGRKTMTVFASQEPAKGGKGDDGNDLDEA